MRTVGVAVGAASAAETGIGVAVGGIGVGVTVGGTGVGVGVPVKSCPVASGGTLTVRHAGEKV